MNELIFLDSLFNDLFDKTNTSEMYHAVISSPRVDVKEIDNTYTLEMELPGRCEDDVNIELDHNNLIISSKTEENKEEKKEEEKKQKWILKERRTCNFNRRFTLPSDVDADSITASFKNGVLTINMQKKAIAAPKKILIEKAS